MARQHPKPADRLAELQERARQRLPLFRPEDRPPQGENQRREPVRVHLPDDIRREAS